MIEIEGPDGVVYEFPEGTPQDVMANAMRKQYAASAPAVPVNTTPMQDGVPVGGVGSVAPTATPVAGAAPQTLGSYATDTANIGIEGARKGMSGILGAPVDLVNAAPMVANLIPGVDGVGPISQSPVMGSEFIDTVMSGFGAIPDAPKPQDPLQNIVGRVGQEIGATIPIVGAGGMMAARGVDAVRQMNPIARTIAEPMAVAPAQAAGREATYAVASGAGAGLSNEMAGNPQQGDNFWSDMIGSIMGTAATATAGGALGAAGNALAGATGNAKFVSDVAGEDVALRLAAASSDLASQFERTGRPVDARGLAAQLRRPSAVEQAVPGYQANIGDRSGDAGLSTFAFNQDGIAPGAANARRAGNQRAVDTRIEGLDPGGDPARFRAALEASRDQRVAEISSGVDVARIAFDDMAQDLLPTMPDATARGSSLRGALADPYAAAQAQVREAYAPINDATVPVDVAPLAETFAARTEALPTNDRQRFLPAEAGVPRQLVEPAVPPSESAILGPDGRPLIRPGTPATGVVPLNEVTSLRSGLTDDVRAARAAPGQANKARVADDYRRDVDQFIGDNVPEELQQALGNARNTRRDVADRFERPGTGVAAALQTREGGGYALDDSAVPGRLIPGSDQGNLTDYRAMMREAGTDPRARTAVTDEILSRVQRGGLIERPENLQRFMESNNVVLSDFPELRTRLKDAGASRATLRALERVGGEVTRDLTTPGRSATASYLKFGDEASRDAIRNLTSGPRPAEATRELLEQAGGSVEARQNLRGAFWETVRDKKKIAAGADGERRWSFRELGEIFRDPKTNAVADELWADRPEDLADIREVFDSLATAEGSQRMRAAGSSGTGQILKGGSDPSLTATRIASDMRSVNRGQLSPTVAGIGLLSTWLRNRSRQVQSRAIDTIASAAVNNPDLAADLLEKFNPADFAAKRRMLTQKYGVRVTQLVNLLDEAYNEDETNDAVMEPN